MADGDFREVDLFGDPVLPRHEGRGRPEHVRTLENSNKVLLAFAMRLGVKEAATAIGVSVPTLRKHYSSEVAQREAAAIRFDMVQLHRLNESAKAGSVAAEKELGRRLEKARIDLLSDQVSRNARAPKAAKVGKKAALQQAADELRGQYEAPPPPPGLLN
ncbi:hypothetical protein AVM11_08860 [Sphingomonas melonis TY]|uniref:Uncharacterized protein n=1 Tax=Sphingomonas melonis TY TaxID=621456 RepID=A0A175Y066_9SPHN|nr:hypothetical protein [Sphingomonas melonis]AOW22223.1 hypothetical protein BJP26_00520 [Sphingomonas melonis TY]KZB94103.1 hypothetical protein AVM11_08860 [Sphingomonas melonis TY]